MSVSECVLLIMSVSECVLLISLVKVIKFFLVINKDADSSLY